MKTMPLLETEGKEEEDPFNLTEAWAALMAWLHSKNRFNYNMITDDEVQKFITKHTDILNEAVDYSIKEKKLDDISIQRLHESNYIFSGIKTFHELNEAFPVLTDKDGNVKPFKQFLNDVQTINKDYNSFYLNAEYKFARQSALMAAKWSSFIKDGDRYNLQYRTANDERVRRSHRLLHNITLPVTSKFWDYYFPPNGWGCRCTVVQVLKRSYPLSDEKQAMEYGSSATVGKHQEMFKFNPGKTMTTFPAYNAYTIKKCVNCALNNKIELAGIPDKDMCAACKLIRECAGDYTKTQTSIIRKHYLHEMEPLLKKKVVKAIDGKDISIGFTKYGNSHLFSDTFSRSAILTKEDLSSLDKYLESSVFIEDSKLTHTRNDGIDHFYYFKAFMKNKDIRLNIARQVYKRKDGKINLKHFLYSINDIKK